MVRRKNPAAVALGRLGGRARAKLPPEELSRIAEKAAPAGGKARAEKLSAKRRSAIAKKAAAARWSNRKKP
ncbi:MAG: hypothetical protein JOY53_02140 [Acidobacteriaceae bacterium]|nr:hypothetical protein [Acidobacteriaceae bacterium]